MNEGQKRFREFALGKVQPGKESELGELMTESFHRQDDGTFTAEYMNGVVPKMIALLRLECVDDFMKAAAHMRGQVGKA